MLLHVFGHVDLHESVFVAEHELGERFREQRFADAGRAAEQERTGRAFWILQTAAAATDGFRDLLDRLVLADDPLVHLQFHFEQSHGVFAGQPSQRDAGHLGDNLGDDFAIDQSVGFLGFLFPLASDRVFLLLELVGLIAKLSGSLEVLVGDRLFLRLIELLGFDFKLLEIGRTDHRLQADASTRLVDDVDRLVRQATRRDVPLRQLNRFFESLVGVGDVVVFRVSTAQPLKDLDRMCGTGRLDDDRLEAAFEGVIFLDVLAVFVERGRADALQLATAERGLEHVGGVDRAFRTTGTDQSVQFVDEQDRVLRTANFVHDRFDSFFKLTAILRAGDHHRQVEHDDAAIA